MKLPSYMLLAVALVIAGPVCHAGQSVLKGHLRVTFPTADWAETEPPSELRDAFNGTRSPLKLIFHATSQPSQLRFFVTQLDYPTNNDRSALIAGYLDGVRRRCVRQAVGEVVEGWAGSGDPLVRKFEVNVPGNMFIEIRTILCSGRIYSLEMGGSASSRQEAEQALDGVSLFDETSLPPSFMESIGELRGHGAGTGAAYAMTHWMGFVLGGLFVVVALVFVLVLVWKAGIQGSCPLSATKAMRSPPPLRQFTPPVLPPSPPLVLGSKTIKIPTLVYFVLFSLQFILHAVWVFLATFTHVGNDGPVGIGAAFAFGEVLGEVVVPIIVIVGIASIWRQNRGFRGIVRVLFWASLADWVIPVLANLDTQLSQHISP